MTEFRADGVRVLVTGGTSGLGAAMVAALVDAGVVVALTGRDETRARSVAGSLGAVGVGMDVRDEDDVERGVSRVFDELGGLDVLVNNAGIGERTPVPPTARKLAAGPCTGARPTASGIWWRRT